MMAVTTGTAFDRDKLAAWYANRHMDIDEGVVQVLYLPKGAPPREIRLVEVNRLISETTAQVPIDFGVDIGGPDAHTLYVLDVTPDQWEAIQQKKAKLPAGWTLTAKREFVCTVKRCSAIQELWLRQARSDHALFVYLRRNGFHECHLLLFLNIAPAAAGDGPNPEYPWPRGAPVHCPTDHTFALWNQLPNTGHGRGLMRFVECTIVNFEQYG